MSIATLTVRLTAETASFERGFAKAERDLQKSGRTLESIGERMTKGLSLPLAALGGVAAKAAIDFESSFAGIRKTVDGVVDSAGNITKAGLEIQGAMRNLAKEIPVSVNALNGLGETAGALGIPRDRIVEFSTVMAELGVTTNVTADQAANSIARIQNIFGAAGQDTDRFASTLVALGNAGASTESEILAMATRIAGAGKTIGLSQGQVLGFANAMASVGIEAEAGGSAISRVFVDIASAAAKGGKDLDNFAKVAGSSSAAFKQAFRDDAAGATTAFVEGLGKIQKSGGDLFGTLESLGLSEIRVRDTLLRMAGAGDLLRSSLDLQGKAWTENTALQREAEQRFRTTASQLVLLKNNLQDVAITFGSALLPAFNDALTSSRPVLGVLESLATGFAALPGPIRDAAIAFGVLVVAISPLTFIFGKVSLAASAVLAGIRLLPPLILGAAGAFGAATTGLSGFSGVVALAGTALSGLAAVLTPLAVPAALIALVAALNEVAKATVNFSRAINDGGFRGAMAFLTAKDDDNFVRRWLGLSGSIDKAADSMGHIGKKGQDINLAADGVVKLGKATDAVVPPLKLAGGETDKFAEAVKSLQDRISGADIVKTAKEWAGALKGIGGGKLLDGVLKLDTTEKQELSGVLEDAVRKFGSLKAAGLGAFDAIRDRVRSLIDLIGITNGLTGKLGQAFSIAGTSALLPGVGVTNGIPQRGLQTPNGPIDLPLGTPINASNPFGSLFPGLTENDLKNQLRSWDLPGAMFDPTGSVGAAQRLAQDSVTPFRDAFGQLGKDLPGIVFGALQGGGSVIGSVASAAGALFSKQFQAAVAAAEKAGIDPKTGKPTQLSAGNKALGVAAGGITAGFVGFGVGQQIGSKGKGALGGAASGALAGSAYGPYGAAVGAGVGLIAGYFGGRSAEKKAKEQLEANKVALAQQFGGMTKLTALADTLGVNIQAAFDAKKPAQFQTAVDKLNSALEDQNKRVQGLGTALDGVNARTTSFAGQFQSLVDAQKSAAQRGDQDGALGAASKLMETAQRTQPEFERLGILTAGVFAGMVKDSGNAYDAIHKLGPSFQVLKDGIGQFGLSSTTVIDTLLSNFDLVNSEAFGPLLQNIQSTGQVLSGLFDAKSLSPTVFQAAAADIGQSLQEIVNRGGDMSQALALSQPVLQKLWEAQQTLGGITDQTTLSILDQAQKQGLVGDAMKSVNDKILSVLVRIARVLGDDIPDGLYGLKSPAEEAAKNIRDAFDIQIPPIRIPYVYDAENGLPDGIETPRTQLARGGIVNRPTVALIGEKGPEAVVPLTGRQLGVDGNRGRPIVINMDGREVARSTMQWIPEELGLMGIRVR